MELILGKEPHIWRNCSVWVSKNRCYIDGKSISVPNSIYKNCSADRIAASLQEWKPSNSYDAFRHYIQFFTGANRFRLNDLKDEAFRFIQEAASKYEPEQIVASFSGSKDSTVTADIAIKALSNSSLVHIFGDTTLEFLTTTEYVWI